MPLLHTFNRLKILLMRVLVTGDSRTSWTAARVIREASTLQRLRRNGLWPVGIVRIEPSRLLHQRPVRCEMIPVNEATTLDFLDRYFVGENGVPNYSIYNSMQYKLLREHVDGEIRDLSQTDYWQWHVKLRQVGINEDKRSDTWIANKIRRLLRAYESIKDRGYNYNRLSNYIWVVNEPLISTRYGYNYHPDGFEIFDGHHRAASVACLGYCSVYVLLVKDVGTHTPFGVPLDEIVTPARG